MANMNLGGRMPDGTKVHDFGVDESDFLFATATQLSIEGEPKSLGGKLCLTRQALIMLPFEGLFYKSMIWAIKKARDAILGDGAIILQQMEKAGIVDDRTGTPEDVIIWPLSIIDGPTEVVHQDFLFLHAGADLIVHIDGKAYSFNMSRRGHEVHGYASAEDFAEEINSLF